MTIADTAEPPRATPLRVGNDATVAAGAIPTRDADEMIATNNRLARGPIAKTYEIVFVRTGSSAR
ncbi:MAG: hypothetical protein CFE29_04060 [Bradyrhizobiaceae bacterium PARB1]|jgi:hypothetical protein|nr:MAG: hypothetical protein CFE29_04060 [Bradyrhizobiaceae bacterium PARB1]